jgi:hypothetical protein
MVGRKPHVAVRSGCNALGHAVVCRNRELGDRPAGCDPADTVPAEIREPDVAIRPGGDSGWRAGVCGNPEYLVSALAASSQA